MECSEFRVLILVVGEKFVEVCNVGQVYPMTSQFDGMFDQMKGRGD